MLSNIEKGRHRREQILLSLNKVGFATREQLQAIHDLGQSRNALKVLGDMREYIQHRNHNGKNVYFLNQNGCDKLGVEGVKWSLQVDHYLLRTDMYIHYQCPDDWRIEKKIRLKPTIGEEKVIVPDATFTVNGIYHFLEVDRIQSMVENRKKIEAYHHFNPLIKNQFQNYPTLIFYTTTTSRYESLSKLCKEKDLNFKIFTTDDLR
jgi:hypothetical protein